MSEYEDIPAVPDERFKEVVQAEIAVLLGLFPEKPSSRKRLTLILKKSPERLADLVTDAEVTQMLRSMAILLPHLGREAVDTVLGCRFSKNERKSIKARELLQIYASRCKAIPQRDGMADMSSREAYLIIDRLIAYPADDRSKAEVLLDIMEACEDSCSSLLFANALLCYEDAAFDLLMDHFMDDSSKQKQRVLYTLVRTGSRFASAALDLVRRDNLESRSAGLLGCEAIARSLCSDGSSRKQFLNDLRTQEKWPPIIIDSIGENTIGDIKEALSSLITDGPDSLRPQALRVLGHLKAGEYAEMIRKYLTDADQMVRMAAIFALSEIGDVESADALIDLAKYGQTALEKAAAVTALGRLQIEKAEYALFEMTLNDDTQVSEAAVVALGEMGTTSSHVALQELMHGSNHRLQKIAAKAAFGGIKKRKPRLSDVDRRLAEKRRKVTPIAEISLDAVMRFGIKEMRSYEERELTEHIAEICSDHCATRRYMIELGLMTRSNGLYEFTESGKIAWRVEKFILGKYLERQYCLAYA